MSELDTPFYCENTYAKRAEGHILVMRLLFVLMYIAFVAAFFAVCYFTKLIPIFALCPVFLWMLVFFTWKYVNYDYFFEFKTGTLTLGRIAGKKKVPSRKPKLEIHVKDAERIVPISAGRVKFSDVKHVYDFSGSIASDKRIAVVFVKNGVTCAAVLECTKALARLITIYNKDTAELAEFAKTL
jgi:hypothetical protein